MNYSQRTLSVSDRFLDASTSPTVDDHTWSFTETNTPHDVGSSSLFINIDAVLWQIVPPVLLVVGTFGNVMVVVVMRGMRPSESTACLSHYFTALAVSDQSLLLVILTWDWLQFSWPPSFYHSDLLCTIPMFVWYTCSITSAWFLVAMTYQRVTSVVVPHRVGVLCTVRRGKLIIAATVMLACVANLHLLFTYKTTISDQVVCQPKEQYEYTVTMLVWLDLCLASLIPFLSLIIGNSVLITHVIKSSQLFGKMKSSNAQQATSSRNQVSAMTIMLVVTSTAFLLLTLPTCLFDLCVNRDIDFSETDDDSTALVILANTVVSLMWMSNSAVNFFLYLMSGRKFRQETKRYLCLCFGDQ